MARAAKTEEVDSDALATATAAAPAAPPDTEPLREPSLEFEVEPLSARAMEAEPPTLVPVELEAFELERDRMATSPACTGSGSPHTQNAAVCPEVPQRTHVLPPSEGVGEGADGVRAPVGVALNGVAFSGVEASGVAEKDELRETGAAMVGRAGWATAAAAAGLELMDHSSSLTSRAVEGEATGLETVGADAMAADFAAIGVESC